MGNRAVITTAPYGANKVGIYVHWNGGRASVEGFLRAAKELGYRTPGGDPSYAFARLAQAIGLYFGAADDCSVGVNRVGDLDTDNSDNGTYLIGKDWEIVGRKFFDGREEIDEAKTAAIAARIVAITRAAQAASDNYVEAVNA